MALGLGFGIGIGACRRLAERLQGGAHEVHRAHGLNGVHGVPPTNQPGWVDEPGNSAQMVRGTSAASVSDETTQAARDHLLNLGTQIP